MNYWLLTTEYPPFHGGGISTYCYQTSNMFAAMGQFVTIFIPDDSVNDYITDQNDKGAKIVRFNTDRSKSSKFLGYSARLSYEFAMIVRHIISLDGPPDIIEAQDYLGIAYYLLQFKYLLYKDVSKIPIVITLHSPAFVYLEHNRVPTYRFPEFWTCEMEKHAITMADHLISPTRYLAEIIGEYIPVRKDILHVIRNPFLTSNQEIYRPERNKIVYYGKLSAQKGSFVLLDYFKQMWDDGFPHPLHIVGGTDIVYHPESLTMGQIFNNQYKHYIKKGLLVIHGMIKPGDLEAKLQNAHVVIVPSIVDNLPYVVAEVMSIGKIVLASVQGGQKEMIDHGLNGFLFDHRLAGDFAAQLEMILSLTDEEIATIGFSAKEKTRMTYDPTIIGSEKLELLRNIVAECSPSSRFPFLFQENYVPIQFPAAQVPDDKLTVVIPYYNMGRYIIDCVQSIRETGMTATNILIIDDGSTEAISINVLEKFREQKGISIFRKAHGGLAEARNFGARLVSTKYLAFLDADDKIAKDYFQKAIAVLDNYENVFFAGAWVSYFGSSTTKYWATFTPQPPYALVHNPINSSSLVYKTQAFLAAGFNDKNVDYGLEDYESVLSLLSRGYNGIVLPEFLFHYRVRSDSMFRQITREKLLYSYKYITEKHQVYYAKFAAGAINLLNANGPGFLFDNPTIAVRVSTLPVSTSRLMRNVKRYINENKTLKKVILRIIKSTNIW